MVAAGRPLPADGPAAVDDFGFLARLRAQPRLEVRRLLGRPLHLLLVQLVGVHVEDLRELFGQLDEQALGGQGVIGGGVRVLQGDAVLGGEHLEGALASLAGNHVLVQNIRVEHRAGRQLTVRDAVAQHLVVEHREVVGGVERDDGHAVKVERTNRAGKLPDDLAGGSAVLTRVLGGDAVHGGGTGGNLDAGVGQPLATAHHITLRVQQDQGGGHDAGGGDVHTGGLKVKGGAQAVHPGHGLRLTQRRRRRAPVRYVKQKKKNVDLPLTGTHNTR